MAVKWRREPPLRRCIEAAMLLVVASFLFLVWNLAKSPQISCGCGGTTIGKERFMWYAPHSGFSNQIGELRNALRVAFILERTLVLPPVTDHHALSLGSCPKSRIVHPSDLRRAAWSHFSELVVQSRYYSIADILNISSVSPKYVKTIDLREFALRWCGADIKSACAGPLCEKLARNVEHTTSFGECSSFVTHDVVDPGCSHCVRAVDDSCATTVWTYKLHRLARRILLAKQKMRKFSGPRIKQDIRKTLGQAGNAKLLAFGSLFSGEYNGEHTHIDFITPSGDLNFDEMFQQSEYFPFVNDILEAGKSFVEQRMRNQPFFCAQLRLLDGQFKNHWSKTFKDLRSRLEGVKEITRAVFLMTDLPRKNWTGTYLAELDSKYQVFELAEGDELVTRTALKILAGEQGLRTGTDPLRVQVGQAGIRHGEGWKNSEVLLYLQEAICSCASTGFQGTAGSTITDNILQMRTEGSCKT